MGGRSKRPLAPQRWNLRGCHDMMCCWRRCLAAVLAGLDETHALTLILEAVLLPAAVLAVVLRLRPLEIAVVVRAGEAPVLDVGQNVAFVTAAVRICTDLVVLGDGLTALVLAVVAASPGTCPRLVMDLRRTRRAGVVAGTATV